MKLPSIRTGPLRVHTKSSSLFGKLMSAILPSHGLAIITAQHYYLFTSPNDLSAQCLASVPLLDAAVRQMAESFTFSVIDRTTRPEEQIDVSAADASDYHAWMDAIAQGSRSAREARREVRAPRRLDFVPLTLAGRPSFTRSSSCKPLSGGISPSSTTGGCARS